jgi:ubiquinone biosynthesis protein
MKPTSGRIAAFRVARDAQGSSPLPQLAQLSVSDSQVAFLLRMPKAERAHVLTAMLDGASGPEFRREAARRIVQGLSVDRLVPQAYAEWRPVVREAMLFFGSHLSTRRLVPKIIEQLELAPDVSPEVRLLRLIARVPALQKLGQVIARNRHLHPAVKRELTQLENGISDVGIDEICKIIIQELGPKLERHEVKIEDKVFSEASVSAVVRFTWYNQERQQREHGVFKVLKPYIREYFAEEMDLLARLAEHLGSKHEVYGFAEHVLSDTFNDVRRLLQHEIRFRREQVNLREASRLYSAAAGIRIPQVIRPLCASTITALSLEHGAKITKAAAEVTSGRKRLMAGKLIDAVIAIPLLAPGKKAIFHADPHAGNVLYDRRSGTLTLLDWALTAHITEEQRRQLARLFVMTLLRDQEGVRAAIEALSPRGKKRTATQSRVVRGEVRRLFEELPLSSLPDAVDVMRLLEAITWRGVRLPSNLVMLRKAVFTLDGILHELAGSDSAMEMVIARRLLKHWLKSPTNVGWPLSFADWVAVYWSSALYCSRVAMEITEQLSAYWRHAGAPVPMTVHDSRTSSTGC